MLKSGRIDTVFRLFAVLTLTSFLFPYETRPLPEFYRDAVAVFALIAGIGAFVAYPRTTFRLPVAAFLPVALIIVIALQAQNGFFLSPADGFLPIVSLACFAIAIIFGATLVTDQYDLERLCLQFAWIFALASLISVGLQHIQLIGFDARPFIMPVGSHKLVFRPYGNLGQPNLLAQVLCCGLASTWWLYTQKKMSAKIALAFVAVILWGLALTQSRIAWIILPIFSAICWFQPSGGSPLGRRVLLVQLALYIIMVCIAPSVLRLSGFNVDSVTEHAGQVAARLILWQQAWAMSVMHPWFGVGWSQFGPNQVKLALLFLPAVPSEHAHDIVLNFAAELGWPITLLSMFATLFWFKKSCVNHWVNPQVRLLSLIFISLTVHSLVEFPLWNAIFLLPFGVMVGALHPVELGCRQIELARGWIILFAVLLLSAFSFVCWDYQRIAFDYHVEVQREAGALVPFPEVVKPAFTLFPQYYDYLLIRTVQIYPGMPAHDIAYMEKLSLEFGYPPVFERLALAYALNNRPREALQVLLTNQRMQEKYYPTSYQIWAELARQNPIVFGPIFSRLPVPKNADIK